MPGPERPVGGRAQKSRSGSARIARPGDSLYDGARVVGTFTSAAYGHRVQKNLAMGFIEPDFGAIGTELGIDTVGDRAIARATDDCLYDPRNQRMHA